MIKIVRRIEGEKLNEKQCRKIERKDKEKIEFAVNSDRLASNALMAMLKEIPFLVNIGLYSVDEAFEIHKRITEILDIKKNRDAEAMAKRVCDLSVRRIAEAVGGEVVEEAEA